MHISRQIITGVGRGVLSNPNMQTKISHSSVGFLIAHFGAWQGTCTTNSGISRVVALALFQDTPSTTVKVPSVVSSTIDDKVYYSDVLALMISRKRVFSLLILLRSDELLVVYLRHYSGEYMNGKNIP